MKLRVLCLFVSVVCATSFERVSAQATQWNLLAPTSAAPQRAAMAMAYDPVSHRTVLFGGYDASGYRNDTWLFDGQTWTQASTPVAPPRRAAASMSFDEPTQRLVLFGGYNGSQYLGDTWLWDGATLSWTHATPTTSPVAVTGPMTFTDPLNGHADCFGGFNGSFYQLKTWQWTGSNWVDLHPTTSPFARGAGIAETDLAHHKTVLFGGLGSVNPWNTWLWDGANWQIQSPSQQPALRYYSGAAFDPYLQSVVVFGGGSGGAQLDDTWRWTGSDWVQLATSTQPYPRESFGMAYDENVHRVIVVGGEDATTQFDDTWSLSSPTTVAAFCTAGTTSNGCVPAIGATGMPSASASSGFTLSVQQLEGQKQGLFFYGLDNTGFAPLAWGPSSSFLCVKAPTQRLPILTSGGTLNACDGTLAFDWNAFVASTPGVLGAPFAGGESVYAQAWFRDPPSPKTTMLSDALFFVELP